ncbi:MAG: hypothetical protein GEU88_09160 [Solirubrobacterales bacterium]|nr:hypothetical protein [Solirubrobacterales bacterium]
MPTKHRRIAIVRDEQMERALEAGRAAVGRSRPEAAIARELILRGAEAMRPAGGGEWERLLVERHGARPAHGSIREALDELEPLPPVDPDDARRATSALEELREERLP